jgi:hypothetical protein
MQTLAIKLDDDTYSRAEQKASSLNTSVPEVVADYLRAWSADGGSLAAARAALKAKYAKRDWEFGVGTPDNREQRNARR